MAERERLAYMYMILGMREQSLDEFRILEKERANGVGGARLRQSELGRLNDEDAVALVHATYQRLLRQSAARGSGRVECPESGDASG